MAGALILQEENRRAFALDEMERCVGKRIRTCGRDSPLRQFDLSRRSKRNGGAHEVGRIGLALAGCAREKSISRRRKSVFLTVRGRAWSESLEIHWQRFSILLCFHSGHSSPGWIALLSCEAAFYSSRRPFLFILCPLGRSKRIRLLCGGQCGCSFLRATPPAISSVTLTITGLRRDHQHATAPHRLHDRTARARPFVTPDATLWLPSHALPANVDVVNPEDARKYDAQNAGEMLTRETGVLILTLNKRSSAYPLSTASRQWRFSREWQTLVLIDSQARPGGRGCVG